MAKLLLNSDPASFLVRLVLLLAGIAIGWFAFADAAGSIFKNDNPQLALRFSNEHPKALAIRGDRLLFASENKKFTEAQSYAKKAILAEPLNVRAMRLYGMTLELQGKTDRAHELVSAAMDMSRRDFGTHLWMIKFDAANGDVESTIKHYDRALRINRQSRTVLFPLLSQAIVSPDVRAALFPYIRKNPSWLSGFAGYAIGEAESPLPFADLVLESGGLPDIPAYRSTESHLISRLVSKGEYDSARAVFNSLDDTDRAVLKTVAFTDRNIDPDFQPLTWQAVEHSAISAGFQIDSDSENHALMIAAGPNERGQIAQKLIFLDAGRFLFSSVIANRSNSSGAELSFTAECVVEKRDVLFARNFNLPPKSANLTIAFDVPEGCRAQLLKIIVSGGSSQFGSELSISGAEVKTIGKNDQPELNRS